MKSFCVNAYDGSTQWFNYDRRLHREDGPATEKPDGSKLWYIEGLLHRLDGPAIDSANGSKLWYVNGILHRLDGPAFENAHGVKVWYINGKRHRIGGPGAEWIGGKKEWYVNDNDITDEVIKWMKLNRIYSKLTRNNFQLTETEIIQFKLRFL